MKKIKSITSKKMKEIINSEHMTSSVGTEFGDIYEEIVCEFYERENKKVEKMLNNIGKTLIADVYRRETTKEEDYDELMTAMGL